MTGRRLFGTGAHALIMMRIANNDITPPRTLNPDLSPEAEAVVMKALARTPEDRYATALEFAAALEKAIEPAYPHVVSDWIRSVANERLMELSELRARVDADTPSFFDEPSAPAAPFDRSSYAAYEHPTRTRSHIASLGWRGRRRLRSAGAALAGAAAVGVTAFFALRPGPVASGSPLPHAAASARPEPATSAATIVEPIEPVLPATLRLPEKTAAAAASGSGRGSTEATVPKGVHRPMAGPGPGRRARPSSDAAAANSAAAPAADSSASTTSPRSELEVIGGRE
jgi:serine/threonine-protein kinase